MPRIIHFEIPADNPDRAIQFYKEVFGWQFHKFEGPMEYWLVTTGPDGEPGINGGLMRRNPGQTTCNTVGVRSVDQYVAAIQGKGGQIALPKMAIPGVGWVAYCTDPEGNVFGVFQDDKAAK